MFQYFGVLGFWGFGVLVREMSVRVRDREILIEAIELQVVSIKITLMNGVVRKMMTSMVDQ